MTHNRKNNTRQGTKQLEDDATTIPQSHNNVADDVRGPPNTAPAAAFCHPNNSVADDVCCPPNSAAATNLIDFCRQKEITVADYRRLPNNIVAIHFFRQQDNVIADFYRFPTSTVTAASRQQTITATDGRRLPNSTIVDAVFCHQHNNIDDDNRLLSKRTPTGH